MDYENLVGRLKSIPTGTKLTLIAEDFFGKPYGIKVTTCGEIRKHGFLTSGGGWGLYKFFEDEKPCYEILVKPYRKRRPVWMKIGYTIKDFRYGW